MNVFNEIDMRKKLDENLVYMENIDNDLAEDEVINFFIECLDYCNKLSLYDYKEKIKEKIYELGYKDDIRLELGLNNPYLYIDNDDYTGEYYFNGVFKNDVINENKEFSYRFQDDKYIRNETYFEDNKYDVDYVIRNYKNILLNTTNEELNKKCLDKIYEIYENNSFMDILEKEDIEIIEYGKEDTEEDLISVILINYNNDDYIEDTIKSIYEQTYKNIELIIGDNCSENLTIEKYRQIINKYRNENIKRVIIYRNKVNVGLVSNANKAVLLAGGKFIKFISGDDIFYNKNVVSDLIDKIIKTDVDVLISEMEENDINMNRICISETDIILSESMMYDDYLDNRILSKIILEKGSIIPTPPVTFKKSIFEEYGLFNEEYFIVDDWPNWIKLSQTDCKFAYYKYIAVKYRKGSGVTSSRPKGINNDFLNIWKKYYPQWMERLN